MSNDFRENLAPYFKDVQDHIEKVTKLWKRQKKQWRSTRTRTICSAKKKPTKYWVANYSVHTIDPSYSHWHILRHEHQSSWRIRRTGSWTLLGSYTSLIFALVVSSISALLMTLYFRRVGWLDHPGNRGLFPFLLSS